MTKIWETLDNDYDHRQIWVYKLTPLLPMSMNVASYLLSLAVLVNILVALAKAKIVMA